VTSVRVIFCRGAMSESVEFCIKFAITSYCYKPAPPVTVPEIKSEQPDRSFLLTFKLRESSSPPRSAFAAIDTGR
jgi:hypothetical protein